MVLQSIARVLALLSFCFAATCFAQEPTSPVKTAVELGGDAEFGLGSLKRILQIRSISGSFQLEDAANSFRLRLDFYRKAKPVPVAVRRPGVGGQQARRYGRFDAQIVDLDYLKLGDAPADHWRIFVSLMTSDEPMGGGTTALGQFDVAKTAFNARPRTGAIGRFEQFPRGDDGSIPLFYSASGRVQRAKTLPELLKANPEADILVGVLEVR